MANDNFDLIKVAIFILIAFGGAAISIIKKIVDTIKKQNGSNTPPSLDDVLGSFKAKKSPKRIRTAKKTTPVAPVYEMPVEYEQPIVEEPIIEQTAYTINNKSVRTGSLKDDLRKAMVLHEILKPPKGLSDDF